MRWRLPSRPRCSLVVLVAAAGHDGRRPANNGRTAKPLKAVLSTARSIDPDGRHDFML
jgi:hypothetical protein